MNFDLMRKNAVCFIWAIVLTVAFCFLSFPKFTKALSFDDVVKLEFVWEGQKYVYDQKEVEFDDRDFETLHALQNRMFFGSREQKINKIVETEKIFGRQVAVNYVLTGLSETVEKLCLAVNEKQIDSKISFKPKNKNIFEISKGKDGREVDLDKLYDEIFVALKEGKTQIDTPIKKIKALSKQENENRTSLKSSFFTDYSSSSADRKSNVKLALKKFDGMVVKPGQKVSFNQTVGKRTVKNGFKNAKVIENGKYVDGVGGGVCQASTTLYNAALLAGLKIEEWHRHTLRSSYVKPSFDAMVNDNGADLVFVNDTPYDIFIKTRCDDTGAKVLIYGIKNRYTFRREYQVVSTQKAKVKTIVDKQKNYSDKVLYDDETFVLKKAQDGIKTKGYLLIYDGNKLIDKKLLRTDFYNSIDGIIVRGCEKRPKKTTQDDGEFQEIITQKGDFSQVSPSVE